MLTSVGYNIEHNDVHGPTSSTTNEENLFIFSGETENEIWSFNIHGHANIYSETSLRYLRREKTTIHRFNLLQHQQTLYKVEKQDSLEILVFE